MADRNTLRSERRDEADKDPFADLARIIGFDPRVKVQPTGAAPAAPMAAAPAPLHTASTPGASEGETAVEHLADWDSAFSEADLTLDDAEVALDGGDPKPRGFGAPVETGVAADRPSAPAIGAAPPSTDEWTDGSERHSPVAGLEEFETASEIDFVTKAFERAWQQTNQWSTEIEAKDFRIEVSDEENDAGSPPEAPGDAAFEAEPSDDLTAIDLFPEELDDVLAQSIERDLEDAWLQPLDNPEAEQPEPVEEPPATSPTRNEQRVALAVKAEDIEGPVEAEVPELAFEDELRALLDDVEDGEDAGEPAGEALPAEPTRDAPADFDAETEAPAWAAEAEPDEELSAEPPVRPEEPPVPENRVETPAAETIRRVEPSRPRPFSLDVGSLDDDPFAALAAMAERYRSGRPGPVDRAAAAPAPASDPEIEQEPEVEDMKRTPSARYETPEIETFDVPERAVAAADDLDFPEMPFDEPPAPRAGRGGVDEEFADLLEEMSSGEPVRHAAYRPRQPEYAQAHPAPRPMERSSVRQGYEQPRAAQPMQQSWEMEPRSRSEEENEDFFADDEETRIAAEDEDTARPRKRGKWLAALFGSVVIAGGAGAFAMKFTGIADGGLPILVKADANPIKIRPDKPGGTTVPNQDNEVYARVAGSAGVTPAQEKLLSSAEEPVSLDEPELAEDALPGLDMGEEIEAEPEAKAEDRLADADAEALRPSEAPIAVTPRKVRTMAVRADGTIVENDAPAPAVETLVASAGLAIDKVRQGSAGVDVTGSTNSIEPAASNDQAAPASAAAPAVVGADVAAGTWSMQIASQPSENAARSSYADLAQRYSAVLAGRNVNIVKAEISGKGTFWRVRVPAETRSAAVDLCTNYKAAGGSCFVSK